MDDSFGLFLLVITLGFFVWASFLLGGLFEREGILISYCESQSAQYEIIGGEDYCVKDNQLFQIEWMEGE